MLQVENEFRQFRESMKKKMSNTRNELYSAKNDFVMTYKFARKQMRLNIAILVILSLIQAQLILVIFLLSK